MRGFLLGVMAALLAIAGAAAWLWYQAPEHLPEALRRNNPNSPDYAPTLYRWKDDQGRTQISDRPPTDRAYDSVRVDPATNVVPDVLPTERDARRERGQD